MQAFLKTGKTNEKSATTATGDSSRRVKPPMPWVEKYRPKNVEEVVDQTEVVNVLRKCVDGSELPNMLLYGPPGTGKTSTILAAAHQIFGDIYHERILELNASDERGINVVRTKIKNFAQLSASGTRPDGRPCPRFKIIILDEADSMTHAAQSALRRTMEKESRSTRFCLICNYVSRIIEPITSRCTKFRFKPLGEAKIIERLKCISLNENVHIKDDAYNAIMKIANGDLRNAITTLQSCHRFVGAQHEITRDDILEITGVVPEKYLEEYLQACRSDNVENLEKFVADFGYEAFGVGQFFEQLVEFVVYSPFLTDAEKTVICGKLGESSYRLETGGSEYIQLMDLGCQIMLTLHK